MSHFTGLVVLTKKYLEEHESEDALAKYDERMRALEYHDGDATDYDKIKCIEWYVKDEARNHELLVKLYDKLVAEGKAEKFVEDENCQDKEAAKRRFCEYLSKLRCYNIQEYANIFKENYPDLFEQFETIYIEHGEEWNGNEWRKNEETGVWERFSTYNPDSKWDWYEVGGRWAGSIKTKDGQYVNECALGDIDWSDFKPEDYCKRWVKTWRGEKYHPLKKKVRWRYTKSIVPFALIIDGEWYEKGQMGWFGVSFNDKENWSEEFFNLLSNVPEDSEATLIDFHI